MSKPASNKKATSFALVNRRQRRLAMSASGLALFGVAVAQLVSHRSEPEPENLPNRFYMEMAKPGTLPTILFNECISENCDPANSPITISNLLHSLKDRAEYVATRNTMDELTRKPHAQVSSCKVTSLSTDGSVEAHAFAVATGPYGKKDMDVFIKGIKAKYKSTPSLVKFDCK